MHIATESKLTPEDRKIFAAEMQSLTPSDEYRVAELSQVVFRKPDQGLQKLAIGGLERIGSPQAILATTGRLCDTWGMSAVSRAICALTKLSQAGGLLALTSTLLVDHRFVAEKLQHIATACHQAQRYPSDEWLTELAKPAPLFVLRQEIPLRVALLQEATLLDVAWGGTLAALLRPRPLWAVNVREPDPQAMQAAKAFAEKRLPGLVDLLTSGRTLVL